MKKGRLLANAYLVLVFGFLYVPIAVLIAFSFNESKSRTVFTGFTFKWYQNLFHNDMVLKSLGVSLGVAFAAACIATVVGTLAAIGISSMNKRARGAVMAVSYVPVVNPEIITGVSLMLLFVVFNRQVSAALSWLLQREVELQGFGLGTLLIAHPGLRPGHAAHRAHHVLPALCHLQRQPQAAPAGPGRLRRRAGPWLQSPAGVFQGGAAAAHAGHPVGVSHQPHLFH